MDVAAETNKSVKLLKTKMSARFVRIPENRNANRSVRGKILQVLYDDLTLILVVLCGPMVVQVVQHLDATVKFIENITEEASLAESFDWIQQTRGQAR